MNAKRNKLSLHLRRTEGSVSIFLIFVLAFIFLFTAVLIDYARIAAANVQGERLARAAVRSLMSAYDSDLQKRYGLYAYGGGSPEEAVSRLLNDTLARSGRDDGVDIVPLLVDSSTLSLTRPLGDYEVFRQQIAEEMKYKAPIDLTLELAGKFKGISGAMEEASRTAKLYGRLQPLYDQREAALDKMLERRRQAAEKARTLLVRVMNPPERSIVDAGLGGMATAGDIAAQYDDYVRKSYSDMNRSEDEAPLYTGQCSRYQEQRSAIMADIAVLAKDYAAESARLLQEGDQALGEAKELDAEMKQVIAEEEAAPRQAGYASADSWDTPPSEGGAAQDSSLREQAAKLLIPDPLWSSMAGWLSAQREASVSAASGTGQLQALLAPAASLGGSGAEMKQAVLSAATSLDAYLVSYTADGLTLGRERQIIESRRADDGKRKALEQEAKSKMSGMTTLLQTVKNGGGKAEGTTGQFETINRYFEENVEYNRSAAEQEASPAASSDPEEARDSAMSSVDSLYNVLGSVLREGGNRLFQGEYAALYFPAFDISELRELGSAEGEGAANGTMPSLDVEEEELEYVLYGLDKPGLNIAAAYSEIFAIRLAIRTMEGFAARAELGHPLLIVAAALVYGLTEAVKDMAELCRKGSIPVAKSIPIELTYRDYLRLFLLVHGSGESQLSRMLALIRYHTGVNPQESCTYASAAIRYGMRLWFLPGVTKLIQYSGAMPGETEGGVYYRTTRADFSY